MSRKGKVSRKTKETSISVEANIDGKGKYQIEYWNWIFRSHARATI